jgi:hypothetical protein
MKTISRGPSEGPTPRSQVPGAEKLSACRP